MTYHSGEVAVQTRVGVREEVAHLGLIGNTFKPAAEAFLTKQSYLAIAGTVDREEKIWASLLVGNPGFIQVLSPQTVKIHSLPVASDPLYQNLLAQPEISILAIDLVNRRRLQLNDRAELQLN